MGTRTKAAFVAVLCYFRGVEPATFVVNARRHSTQPSDLDAAWPDSPKAAEAPGLAPWSAVHGELPDLAQSQRGSCRRLIRG